MTPVIAGVMGGVIATVLLLVPTRFAAIPALSVLVALLTGAASVYGRAREQNRTVRFDEAVGLGALGGAVGAAILAVPIPLALRILARADDGISSQAFAALLHGLVLMGTVVASGILFFTFLALAIAGGIVASPLTRRVGHRSRMSAP